MKYRLLIWILWPSFLVAAEKDARLEDTGDSFGIGTQGRVGGKTRIGADFQWIRNTNRYPESLTLAGAGSTFPVSAGQTVIGPLPDIENKLTRLKFFATYAAQKNAELRFDFIHERWTTNDWSWLFADGTPYTYTGGTAPNFFDGTTVTQSPKQTSNFLGIRYIYRFQ